MDKKYDRHGCITLFILSIVICAFVRHNIPLQKAHLICKMVNVKNDAIVSHTNINTLKSTGR